MSQLIFVYGTLRNGEINSHLLSEAEFCGTHCTAPRFNMLHLGDYPGVIKPGSTSVSGEVYRVNPQQLIQLDLLEEYPTLYTRERIPTPFGIAWIYLYLGVRRNHKIITSGDWQKRYD